MLKRHLTLLLILAFTFHFVGCKDKNSQSKSDNIFSPKNEEVHDSPPTANEDVSLRARLNQVIECFNQTHEKIPNTKREYLYALRPAETLCKTGQKEFPDFPIATGNTTDPFGLFTLAKTPIGITASVDACNKAATPSAQNSSLTQKLNQVTKDYAAGYSELATLSVKTHDYLEQKNYQDDQCAKGREMHTRLMTLFGQLIPLQKALISEVDQLKNGLDQRQLAKMEKETGKNLDWHLFNYSIQSKILTDTLHPDEEGKVDSTQFANTFPALDKAYTELDAYIQAHPDDAKKTDYIMVSYFLKDYYVKAKLINRTLSSGQKPSDSDLQAVIEAYNQYVENHNRAISLPHF